VERGCGRDGGTGDRGPDEDPVPPVEVHLVLVFCRVGIEGDGWGEGSVINKVDFAVENIVDIVDDIARYENVSWILSEVTNSIH